MCLCLCTRIDQSITCFGEFVVGLHKNLILGFDPSPTWLSMPCFTHIIIICTIICKIVSNDLFNDLLLNLMMKLIIFIMKCIMA